MQIIIEIIFALLDVYLSLLAIILALVLSYGVAFVLSSLIVVLPVVLSIPLLYLFKVNVLTFIVHLSTFGLFSKVLGDIALKLHPTFENGSNSGSPFVRLLVLPWLTLCDIFREKLSQRIYILFSLYCLVFMVLVRRVVFSTVAKTMIFTLVGLTLCILGGVIDKHFFEGHIEPFLHVLFDLLQKPFLTFANASWLIYHDRKGIRRHYRNLLGLFVMTLVVSFYEAELIVHKNNPNTPRKIKFAKVLRSMSLSFAKMVEAARLPQMFRSAAEAGLSASDQDKVNSSIDGYISWLDSIGYPIDKELAEEEPVHSIAEGVYDYDWLLAGTNWRIHAPAMKMYMQPEFRRFQHLIQEYKPSFSYQNLDNQLNSIARYFHEPVSRFPDSNDVLDVVWPIVREIFEHSYITPVSAIYKTWNKKFNVGVYAVSQKRNKFGGFRKLPRREWIGMFGPKKIIEFFENFARYGLIFDTHAQFFTKREWLKPSKWMNDVVRTPVAAMLPEYVSQMVFSAVPNKRFVYEKSPIKLGMPMKHGTFSSLWSRHARFSKHFAGDCTAFDSTIVGPVIKLVKMIRSKGFESHKDYKLIEKVIDRTYDVIEKAKLVSSTSGNVYRKGSGLMTGHASTSTDNSLVMVAFYLVAWKQLTGRSAEEFRHYNELSVYGDDHVLSMSDNAPMVWTWNNIVITMKSWGVTMREEVPSGGKGVPLTKVPFLKKFPRKPTVNDLVDLKRVFGDSFEMPEFLTYHDPESMLGKALAPLLTVNPVYKAKRLQSFMYLCAHNKEVYDIFKEGLEFLFKTYPNVRAQLGKYTPSYDRVIRTWFTSSIKFDFDDDKEDLMAVDDSIVLYGEFSTFERIMGSLSDLPDLVNPALRNVGPIDYMMRLGRRELSWPKQLIARVHGCHTKGHTEAILSNCSYDFLNKEIPFDIIENDSTLLVRHWLYVALHDRKAFSLAFRLTGFFTKLISLNFMFSGYVAQTRPKFTISYYNLFLIYALNFIHVPETTLATVILMQAKIPDVVGFLDDAVTALLNKFWSKIPTSFRDLDVFLLDLTHKQFVVEAPTGSGKSTDMIESIRLCVNTKIVVIEPRVNLCTGLSAYMNSRFPARFGYITGDGTFDEDANVVYVSSRSFSMRHNQFMGKGYVFVVDEFHVDEIDHIVVVKTLSGSEERVIYTSATPKDMNIPKVVLPSMNVYGYDRKEMPLLVNGPMSTAYVNAIQMISRGHNPFMRHLIFVDTFRELETLEQILPGRVGTISSRGVDIPSDVVFIIATSAADVGVTIPNVDIVITRDTHFSQGSKGLALYRLPASTITQRCGRTGRTNNGFAYVLKVSSESIFPDENSFRFSDITRACVETGLPLVQTRTFQYFGYDDFIIFFLRDMASRFPDVDLGGCVSLMVNFTKARQAWENSDKNAFEGDHDDVTFKFIMSFTELLRSGLEPDVFFDEDVIKGNLGAESVLLKNFLRMDLEPLIGPLYTKLFRSADPKGENTLFGIHQNMYAKLLGLYVPYDF